MMSRQCYSVFWLILIASLTGQIYGNPQANWAQWRGPTGDGVAIAADPPTEWGTTKNIKWKTAVPGKGHASPIVWGDRIFVLTAIRTDKPGPKPEQPATPPKDKPGRGKRGGGEPEFVHQFTILCYDRNTGSELWRKVAIEVAPHESGHDTNTFASASPVTDGSLLYASFGSHGIYCYDLEGNFKWKRDLGDMQTRNAFGEGASPALYKDALVIPWDHEGKSFIVCLDAKTGNERWRKDRDEVTSWSTPTIVEHRGVVQVITNATKRTRSYDLKTGDIIWECGGQATNAIATPIVRDGVAYVMTGYRGYAVFAIPLDSKGDITGTKKETWSRTDAGPYVSSGVLYGDTLYYTKGRDAILLSANAKTGEPIIEETRLPGLNLMYASLVAAKDRIYITSREGVTLVIKHGKTLDILATNKMEEPIDASPALVGKQLFLRTDKHLYCIEDGAGK